MNWKRTATIGVVGGALAVWLAGAATSNRRVINTTIAAPTPIELNGRLGLMIPGADGNRSVLSFMVDDGRITRIDVVRNPEKLRRVGPLPA